MKLSSTKRSVRPFVFHGVEERNHTACFVCREGFVCILPVELSGSNFTHRRMRAVMAGLHSLARLVILMASAMQRHLGERMLLL